LLSHCSSSGKRLLSCPHGLLESLVRQDPGLRMSFIPCLNHILMVAPRFSILGTFLGDYFGILMDHKVEGFPFNILSDPMYDGSTMCFAATALWYIKLMTSVPRSCAHWYLDLVCRCGRPAGLFVTAFVYIVYGVALALEGYDLVSPSLASIILILTAAIPVRSRMPSMLLRPSATPRRTNRQRS
jgi:hypothetical protein